VSKECAKCGGTMTVGVIVDHGHGQSTPERGQEGEAIVSKWWGLRVDKKALLDVETWRCTKCGYLESYAADKP
jgi:predicted nucleic-acid-binding Zn-ribbon protein